MGQRTFVSRTPAKCPRRGRWTAKATFQVPAAVDGAPVGAPRKRVDELRCRRGWETI